MSLRIDVRRHSHPIAAKVQSEELRQFVRDSLSEAGHLNYQAARRLVFWDTHLPAVKAAVRDVFDDKRIYAFEPWTHATVRGAVFGSEHAEAIDQFMRGALAHLGVGAPVPGVVVKPLSPDKLRGDMGELFRGMGKAAHGPFSISNAFPYKLDTFNLSFSDLQLFAQQISPTKMRVYASEGEHGVVLKANTYTVPAGKIG